MTKYHKRLIQILKSPELFVFITLAFFTTIYSLVLSFGPLGADNIKLSYPYAVVIFELVPCAIFISFVLLETKINPNKLYDIILIMGMLQVACVILTMIVPELRDQILLSSGVEALQDNFIGIDRVFRIYGLARGYTFAMPLFQGLCIIIAYILGSYKSSKYYLLIPFFVVSIAVNARIALVSLLIAPCVIFFFKFKKQWIKQIASILLIFFSFLILRAIVQYKAEDSSSFNTWVWLDQGIEDLIDFKNGETSETGNVYALTDRMWFAPNSIHEWIFGTGEYVFGKSYQSSDIGYVINLYYGGLVFSLLLYLSYLFLLMKYYTNDIIQKNISVSLIVYLFIANCKGNVFMSNEIINGSMLMIVFSIAFRLFHQNRSNDYYEYD